MLEADLGQESGPKEVGDDSQSASPPHSIEIAPPRPISRVAALRNSFERRPVAHEASSKVSPAVETRAGRSPKMKQSVSFKKFHDETCDETSIETRIGP